MATLYVGSDQTYKTIKDAISKATAGDTIIVNAGNYSGEGAIYLDKTLTLQAADGAEVIVDRVSLGTDHTTAADYMIVTDANMATVFVNAEYTGVVGADLGDGKYFGVNAFADFESALRAACTNSAVTRIEIESDLVDPNIEYTAYNDIAQKLTIGAAAGKKFTVDLGAHSSDVESVAIRVMGDGASLTIEEGVKFVGLDVVADGFATTNEEMIINGEVRALSLKVWTNNNGITVNETGKVTLGYGDGQLDLAYGNGFLTVNGTLTDTTDDSLTDGPQFRAGYSGTRGNGNTINLNNTYFEGGAWFTVNSSNGAINMDNSVLKVSGGDGAGSLTVGSSGNKINVDNGSRLIVANVTVGANNKIAVDGSSLEISNLTNNGAVEVSGESTLNVITLSGNTIDLMDGAIIKDSTVGGGVFVAGNVTFRGDNTFGMLFDFGTQTDYYGTTAPMAWTVEAGASVTLTNTARYGLGYGDKVVVNGEIAANGAAAARATLTDDDATNDVKQSLFMHGLVAQESAGWNCDSSFTVNDAFVTIGDNDSFGNKPGDYGGTYTFSINNSVVNSSRITFYEALSKTTFTFKDSDVEIGQFMTRDQDSVFTLDNTNFLSTATSNGTDEGNYNAAELNVTNGSTLTYSFKMFNEATGKIVISADSKLIAPEIIMADGSTITIDGTNFAGGVKTIIDVNSGSLADKVTLINGEGLSLIYGEDGDVMLTDASTDKLYVNAAWGDKKAGDVVDEGLGLVFGVNAFATTKAAYMAARDLGGEITIDLSDAGTETLDSTVGFGKAGKDGVYTITGGNGRNTTSYGISTADTNITVKFKDAAFKIAKAYFANSDSELIVDNSVIGTAAYGGHDYGWFTAGTGTISINNSIFGINYANFTDEQIADMARSASDVKTGLNDGSYTYWATGNNNSGFHMGTADSISVTDSTMSATWISIVDRGLVELDNSVLYYGAAISIGAGRVDGKYDTNESGWDCQIWWNPVLSSDAGFREGKVAALNIKDSIVKNIGSGNGNAGAHIQVGGSYTNGITQATGECAGELNLTDSELHTSVYDANGNVIAKDYDMLVIKSNGTVNMEDSKLVTAKVINEGAFTVTGESAVTAEVSGNGWINMDSVTLDDETDIQGGKVRFTNGTSTLDGAVINANAFQVGIGGYEAKDERETVTDVVVNVTNNSYIHAIDNDYYGWVGTGWFESDEEKAAGMTDARYTLNISNSVAEFGYFHVSTDGILNVTGNAGEKKSYTGVSYSYYGGRTMINGVATFDNVDALVQYTNVSCDNGTDKPGKLVIKNGANYVSWLDNSSTIASFKISKNGIVEVDDATLDARHGTSIARDAVLTVKNGGEFKGNIVANAGSVVVENGNFTADNMDLQSNFKLTGLTAGEARTITVLFVPEGSNEGGFTRDIDVAANATSVDVPFTDVADGSYEFMFSDGGEVFKATTEIVNGKLTVNGGKLVLDALNIGMGAANITGDVTVNVGTLSGSYLRFEDSAIVGDSAVGGNIRTFGDFVVNADFEAKQINMYGTTTVKAGSVFTGSTTIVGGGSEFTLENGATLKSRFFNVVGGTADIEGDINLEHSDPRQKLLQIHENGVVTLTGTITIDGHNAMIKESGKLYINGGALNVTKWDQNANDPERGGILYNNGSIAMDVNSTISFNSIVNAGTITIDMSDINNANGNKLFDYTGKDTDAWDLDDYKAIIGNWEDASMDKFLTVEGGDLIVKKNAVAFVNSEFTDEDLAAGNKFKTHEEAVEKGFERIITTGGKTNGSIAHDGKEAVVQAGTFNGTVSGGAVAFTDYKKWADYEFDTNLTVEGGIFDKLVMGGTRVDQGSSEQIGDSNLTITGGTFNKQIVGGMAYADKSVKGQALLTGNVNLTISGGKFESWIYGGNYSQDGYSTRTAIEGSITVKVNASADITFGEGKGITLVAGSYGNGLVTGGTNVVFTGSGDYLKEFDADDTVWGGSSADVYINENGTRTFQTAVGGDRIFTFDKFTDDFDALIRGFNTMEVKGSKVNVTNANLSDIKDWIFDRESKLYGSFVNDFAGDTFDVDLTTGWDGSETTLFSGDVTGFEKMTAVTLGNETATFDGSSCWASANYELTLEDNTIKFSAKSTLA